MSDMGQKIFNAMELDAIGEMMNISLGSSATAVSNILNHRVDITTPTVSVVSVDEFSLGDLEPAIGVEIKYVSGLEGSNIMLLKRKDVKMIVDILMGTETPDEEFKMDELTVSAVCEVMNQMMGASSTALSDFLGRPVNISTPESYTLDDLDKFKKDHFQSHDGLLVVVRFKLGIEDILESEFVNVMSVDLARELLAGFGIGGDSGKEKLPSEETQKDEPQNVEVSAPESSEKLNQNMIDQLMNGTVSSTTVPGNGTQPQVQSMPQPQVQGMPQPQVQSMPQPQVQGMPQPQMQTMPQPIPQQPVYYVEPKVIRTNPVSLPTFDASNKLGEEQAQNLDLIMSVPLEVSVEIGRTKRKVEEILSFSKGSLVVLDKLAGDQVDVFVNGLCVAHGDVVVIDDNFGVRITEVLHRPELFGVQNKLQK